jgi:hypothetical protein
VHVRECLRLYAILQKEKGSYKIQLIIIYKFGFKNNKIMDPGQTIDI